MSQAHLHLLLTHAPLFAVGFGALGLAWVLVRPNDAVARFSLALLVLAGLLVIPTYLTGEGAEDAVERQPGVSEASLEAHEDAALGAGLAVGAAGLLGLAALVVYRRRPLPRAVTAAALATAAVAFAWTGYVANLGGQVHHPEIRGTVGQAGVPGGGMEVHREADDD